MLFAAGWSCTPDQVLTERTAAMFETTVAVTGNVVTDPEVRETSRGDRVVSFRVASTARRFDKSTETWVDGNRFFATVKCWRRLADGVGGTLRKSDPVVVSGRLRTREYESGGQWRSIVEIEASAVGLDLGRTVRGPHQGPPAGEEAPLGATGNSFAAAAVPAGS